MKKLILILLFCSCQKTVEKINSTQASNLVGEISFYPDPLPKRTLLDSSDRHLIGDTFYSPAATITDIQIEAANSGGYTSHGKLYIDGILRDTILYPEIGDFGKLIFLFTPNTTISEGIHVLQFKGISRGTDSLNVFFTISSMNTVENHPVEGLPVTKKRWYIND